MKKFKFKKPLVESQVAPELKDTIWVDVNEATGKVKSMKELVNGEWVNAIEIGSGGGESVGVVVVNSSTYAPTSWPEEWDSRTTTDSGYLPWKAEVDTDVYVYGAFVQATIDNPVQVLHLPSPTSPVNATIKYKRVYTNNAWPNTWTLVQ